MPCHCVDGKQVTDAAIHRVSRARVRLVSSFTGSQWIATGYAHAMITRFFMDEGRFCLLTYNRGSACWHGPFGLTPLLARPAALRHLLVSLSVILPSKVFSLREEFP